MKTITKQILLSIGLLTLWFIFVLSAGAIAHMVLAALGGWMAGGIIYNIVAKVFPNE